jgi:hypothetical protein
LILHQNPELLVTVIQCGKQAQGQCDACASSNKFHKRLPCPGINGFNLSHKEGARSLLDFFAKVTALGCDSDKYSPQVLMENRPAIEAVFGGCGDRVVAGLLHGVAGDLHHARIREAGQVLFNLRSIFGDASHPWFFGGLSALPAPPAGPFSDEQKQIYMGQLLAATTGRDIAQETLRAIQNARSAK